jgi:hypothetical protein
VRVLDAWFLTRSSQRRQDQGDKDRRIAYSRESLLSVRPAACRDNKGELAGIDVCKNEVEEALMWESEGISSCSHFPIPFVFGSHGSLQTVLRLWQGRCHLRAVKEADRRYAPGFSGQLDIHSATMLLHPELYFRSLKDCRVANKSVNKFPYLYQLFFAKLKTLNLFSWWICCFCHCACSTGCRFGDGCRFLHHIPSSHHEQAAVAKKMSNLNLGRGDPATVKTRLCKNHETREGCKWGDACHFAHGKGELGKPMGPGSSFKTRLCVSFVTSGSCAFGGKCHFAHGEDELRSSDAL